jgi:hypothetical protein
MDLGNLLALYKRNRLNAEKRGIAYTLTFKAWLDVWGFNLLNRHRGAGKNRLQLERIDKTRGYEVGNVHLVAPAKKQKLTKP